MDDMKHASLLQMLSNIIRLGIVIGVVILIGYGIALTKDIFAPISTIPTVPYCELVREPMRYDKAIVRVRAIHVVGFEWSYLMDNECSEQTWTILVPDDPACSVDVPTPSIPVDRRGGMRSVLVVGQFHGERRGYGHLGQYPYRFEVNCIEEASAFIPWILP